MEATNTALKGPFLHLGLPPCSFTLCFHLVLLPCSSTLCSKAQQPNCAQYISACRFLKGQSHVRSIDFIQHHVNQHAGDRDIEPYRESPAGNFPVAVKPLA